MIGAFSIFSHLLLSFLKHTAHYIRKQIKKKGGTYPSRRHLSMLFFAESQRKILLHPNTIFIHQKSVRRCASGKE